MPHKRPNENDAIAFSCRSGKRSTVASEAAIAAGFKDVHNYKGSANEWFSR